MGDYNYYYQIFFDQTFTEVKQTPNNIFTALAKIGGLFAFVKIISLFFRYIHYRYIYRNLKNL